MGSPSYAGWTTERMQQPVRTVFVKIRLLRCFLATSRIGRAPFPHQRQPGALVQSLLNGVLKPLPVERRNQAVAERQCLVLATGPAAMSALPPLLGNCGRLATGSGRFMKHGLLRRVTFPPPLRTGRRDSVRVPPI